jgi:hypothetical protein
MKNTNNLKITTQTEVDKDMEIHNEIREKILLGLAKTYENMLEFKRQKNSYLVVSQNGVIVKLKP